MKVERSMSQPQDVAGLAALAICESLLLALNDADILPEKDIMGILKDAVSAHKNASDSGDSAVKTHNAVAGMIQKIIDGGNSVRR